jgi:peptide-methionine (S)-S-oxide reductase
MWHMIMMNTIIWVSLLGGVTLTGCAENKTNASMLGTDKYLLAMNTLADTATFGTGCFWCTEAVFQELKGVLKVTSGYSGGHVANPTYEQVTSKKTGHAEVVQIVFDPSVITFDELLEVFWQVHDPTTLNRQGADEGPQYRSAIFYHDSEQKDKAIHYKQQLDNSGAFSNAIVTEISPFKNFYTAEGYHQNFYSNNPNYGYCSYVIKPKLDKFRKAFEKKLRSTQATAQ